MREMYFILTSFHGVENGVGRWQVRFLVGELRKQVDTRVGELADDLAAEPQHASGDPDALIFKVDQKLLPPAVRPVTPLFTIRDRCTASFYGRDVL